MSGDSGEVRGTGGQSGSGEFVGSGAGRESAAGSGEFVRAGTGDRSGRSGDRQSAAGSGEFLVQGVREPGGRTLDLYVRAGVLADPAEAAGDVERIDGTGLIVLPGLVDLRAHLCEPGGEQAETLASGARAAARGGFTAVLATADTDPVCDTAEAARLVQLAAQGEPFDIVPTGAVTKGRHGTELAELIALGRAGVRMFSDADACLTDAAVMRRALEQVGGFGGVVTTHAQDTGLADAAATAHEGALSGRLGLAGWPAAAESTIVSRDVQLAMLTGARLHVAHVSAAETVEVLRWAKARGAQVTADVSPAHLLFDESAIAGYDPTYKITPPLRTTGDREALRQALIDGTIDAVASDHAPVEPQDKDHPFDIARPGALALEQTLAVVWETVGEALGAQGVADRLSYAPARIAGLTGHGRPLTIGEPATFVLVDLDRRATVEAGRSASLSSNNPYVGVDLPDPVTLTVWAGRRTYERD